MESTNELLSTYAMALTELLHFETLRDLFKDAGCQSSSDVRRVYRRTWSLGASVAMTLMRITSNDLRFWLNETPHAALATSWATRDLQRMKAYASATGMKQAVFELTLEEDGAVERFWAGTE
jgi:hypothetical protein